jgi:nucleoside triphosphate diphosphatase
MRQLVLSVKAGVITMQSKPAALVQPEDERIAAATRSMVALMARLRDPVNGCPWDVAQTFATIAPYTIEEAYEVADAITRGDMAELKSELGDLLFQVVFHARMAEEQGAFDFADVAAALEQKMVERHPHVFGMPDGRSANDQITAWDDMKAAERARKAGIVSILDDVALALPALMRAEKLQKRAARVGFDWTTPEPILEKLEEELAELDEARADGDPDRIEDELGDVLFVVANLARRLSVDPEAALRRANAKFERRFRYIEAALAAEGRKAETESLDALEALWQAAKQAERKG